MLRTGRRSWFPLASFRNRRMCREFRPLYRKGRRHMSATATAICRQETVWSDPRMRASTGEDASAAHAPWVLRRSERPCSNAPRLSRRSCAGATSAVADEVEDCARINKASSVVPTRANTSRSARSGTRGTATSSASASSPSRARHRRQKGATANGWCALPGRRREGGLRTSPRVRSACGPAVA